MVSERKKDESLLGALIKKDASDVADEIIFDHIVPGLIDMVSDALHSTIDLFLSEGGGRRSYRRSRRSRDGYYRSYDDYYDYYDRRDENDRSRRKRRRDRDDYDDRDRRHRKDTFDLEDVEFDSKEDAKEVLESIKDLLVDFDSVSLEDVYRIPIVRELADTKPDWTASRYGWSSITGAKVIEVRGRRYIIEMPPIERI